MMDNRNRNLLIVLAFVVIAACCLVALVAVVLSGWLAFVPANVSMSEQRLEEYSEMQFAFTETPILKIDNFAGDVTIRAGEGNDIFVSATKKARRQSELGEISIEPDHQADKLEIRTYRQRRFGGNQSVALEVTAPAGTMVEVVNGAGEVTIVGLAGEIKAHTGAGSIEVRDGGGPVDLNTGAGSIEYRGRPRGVCRFETGAGSIELTLPADVAVEVDLGTGVGQVALGGFDVTGDVSSTWAEGRIGSGQDGSIYAHTGAGSIELRRE
jgi:DUF4097 and DUF4098 domain-containing protein YvlB